MTEYKNVTAANSGLFVISLDSATNEFTRDPVVQWAWLDNGLYPLPVTLTRVIDQDENYCLLHQDGSVSEITSDSTKRFESVEAWLAEHKDKQNGKST